jgi:adenylylsulfate kinase
LTRFNKLSTKVSKFSDAGVIAITAFISPYRKFRNFCRELVEPGQFIEVYCKASLDTCEKRDPKGMYKKAREGIIKDFTGIDAPYEEPENPEVIVDTDKQTVEESVDMVINILKKFKIID